MIAPNRITMSAMHVEVGIPRVTVGIPTYNRCGLLKEAIECVLHRRSRISASS